MTRSIVVLWFLLLLAAVPAYAVDEVSEIDVCRDFSIIARDIMTARHKNRPMSESLPIAINRIEVWAEEFELDSVEAEEMAAALVIAAYDSNVFPSSSTFDESRQEEISKYENSHFEECYKSLTSD